MLIRRVFIILIVIGFGHGPVLGETSHRLALLGAADSWIHPEDGYHGFFMAAYDIDNFSRGMNFSVEFNTDTIRISLNRIPIVQNKLELGIRGTYEFRFAGLLMDHYVRGKNDRTRGFEASCLFGEAFLKANLPVYHHLELAAGVRKWSFSANDDTAPELLLPQGAWVFEPQLRYTYWSLQNDTSLKDRHRLFPRVQGVNAGLAIGLDVRYSSEHWGVASDSTLDPEYNRNRPGDYIFKVRQWFRAGVQLHDRHRIQVSQVAAFGINEDDLTRARIGGLNPYVVPIAGAPWAAFISEKFIAAELSWHMRVWRSVESGLLVHAVVLEDVERNGREDVYGFVGGLGVFLDARLGDFQVDLRGGWSPGIDWQDGSGQFSIFGAVGWQWE